MYWIRRRPIGILKGGNGPLKQNHIVGKGADRADIHRLKKAEAKDTEEALMRRLSTPKRTLACGENQSSATKEREHNRCGACAYHLPKSLTSVANSMVTKRQLTE